MDTLTVLYDARCNLCSHLRAWLEAQPAYVELAFVPAGSPEARRRFPALDHAVTTSELTVISDDGAVYIEAKAFLICLWALRDYRAWSIRLSSPDMIPLARRVVLWVAQNRFRFGSRSLDEILSDNVRLAADCADGCRVE
jgi:predicted DCC family thiol-disulfide oxidoreductase YuxK